jgi:hypothetical protein
MEHQTTNLGVGSSNLSGRATSPANHSIILESQKLPCRSEKSAWHLHGWVQVRCNSGNTSETESAILFQRRQPWSPVSDAPAAAQ